LGIDSGVKGKTCDAVAGIMDDSVSRLGDAVARTDVEIIVAFV
jgi:hypothetical protein